MAKTIRLPAKLAKASVNRSRHLAEYAAEDHRQQPSPSNYAIDTGGELAKEAASKAIRGVDGALQRIPAPRLRVKIDLAGKQGAAGPQRTGTAQPRPHSVSPTQGANNKQAILRAQARRVQQTQQINRSIQAQRALRFSTANTANTRQYVAHTGSGAVRGIKPAAEAAKAPKQTVKAGMKTVKAGRTAVKSGKVTIKTIQATARPCQAAGKTARLTAQAAKKAAVLGAKLTARAALALARMAAAAAKAVVALLSAGGGIIVVMLIAAAAIMALLTSVFGIFFSNESGDGMPMTQAIAEINMVFTNELQSRIDELTNSGSYDSVVVSYDGDYDGDAAMVNNWQDVLGVYAVKTVSDEAAGTEVITLNPQKIEELRKVLTDMNEMEITTKEETETTYDENGDPVTTTTLHIDIRIHSMTYPEGASFYNFNAEQMEMLEELMSPEYYELFAALLSVDVYGGLTASDLTQIASTLPAGAKGAAIVEAALAAVGAPYSKMDCSQLTRHAYAAAGISLPRTSVEQAKYCYNGGYMVGAGQLQPGDLVFWSKSSCKCGRWNEIHHTGVYIGNGKIVDASSAKGRVVLRNLWSGSNWHVYGYARPHV